MGYDGYRHPSSGHVGQILVDGRGGEVGCDAPAVEQGAFVPLESRGHVGLEAPPVGH